MQSVNNELLWILIAVTVAVLLQAGVLLGILLALRAAVRTAKEEADEYRNKLTPIIETGSQLLDTAKGLVDSAASLLSKVKPQLENVVTEVETMSHEVHAQVTKLQGSVDDVAKKARSHADRVDGMTTSVLDGLDRFGATVNEAVHLPIRHVNGAMAAIKAVVDTLRSPAPPRPPRPGGVPRPRPVGEDKDLVV
jgi:hypothetical protein